MQSHPVAGSRVLKVTAGVEASQCSAHSTPSLRWSMLGLLQAYLAQLLPRERGQHCAAVGSSALAVHFAYFIQEPALLRKVSVLLQQYARSGSPILSSKHTFMHDNIPWCCSWHVDPAVLHC